jgi:hypothetical protein
VESGGISQIGRRQRAEGKADGCRQKAEGKSRADGGRLKAEGSIVRAFRVARLGVPGFDLVNLSVFVS